jgi:hypothetical protein
MRNQREGDSCFVITVDGLKINGTNAKINSDYRSKKYLNIMMDGQEYQFKNLRYAQVNQGYCIHEGDYWFSRIAKGKKGLLEAYVLMEASGNVRNTAFIRKSDSKLENFTTRSLYNYIQEYPTAVELFSKHFKKINDNLLVKDPQYVKLIAIISECD